MMEEYIEQIQKNYASADGYGHHFNRYDGTEDEIKYNDIKYYYFRVD